MPIDVSMYPTQQAAPFNPLTAAQGYISAANAIQENKLLQQQVKGKVAIGKAIQNATDPQTGTLDQNEFNRLVAKDPDAQVYALQAANEARNANPLTHFMGTQNGSIVPMQAPESNVRAMNTPGQQANPAFAQPQPSQDQIDTLHQHADAGLSLLQPLASDPNLNESKVIDAHIAAVAHPDIDYNATDAAQDITNMPHGPNGSPASSQQLQAVVQQKLQQLQQTKAHLDANYPSSSQIAAKKAAAALTVGGTPSANGTPPQQLVAGGQQPPQAAPSSPPATPDSQGTATGLPIGFAENQAARQKHYLDVQNSANSVPQENAALNNILNISKSGVPSGTMIGQIYKTLAGTGLAPEGIEDPAAQLKLIQSHAAQIAIAGGMPGSDARLEALENAHVGDSTLPKVIQTMVPYLIAVNNGKLQQAKYYQQTAGDGTNPDAVAKAQTSWNQNFDPRLLEMKQLMSNPTELNKYVKELSTQDKQDLLKKYNAASQLGIIGQ